MTDYGAKMYKKTFKGVDLKGYKFFDLRSKGYDAWGLRNWLRTNYQVDVMTIVRRHNIGKDIEAKDVFDLIIELEDYDRKREWENAENPILSNGSIPPDSTEHFRGYGIAVIGDFSVTLHLHPDVPFLAL